MGEPNDARESEYGGMTVNERLFAAGLRDRFDEAARRRDRDALLSILALVEMTPEQAQYTVDTLLQNPSFYGY